MELFTDRDFNALLCSKNIWPLTASREDYPAIGIVIDWNVRTGEIHEVAEIPIQFSHQN